jgi:hypothetical protein
MLTLESIVEPKGRGVRITSTQKWSLAVRTNPKLTGELGERPIAVGAF